MHFEYIRKDSLPRLAWCAHLTHGSDRVVVEHGPWVETHDGFFVEGAWDGSFESGQLDRTTTLLGSGACLGNGSVSFCGTSHTMERLQSVRADNDFYVSNSLAYLLAATDDAPDINYRYYERDCLTFLRGRRRAIRTIPTARRRQVFLYYAERVCVRPDLSVSVSPFPELQQRLANYEDYVALLQGILTRLHANAKSPHRRRGHYTPLATVSSGYDSPACAVLAQTIGCRQAITFLRARPNYNDTAKLPDPRDDGLNIGRCLGLDVETYDRDDYLSRDDYPEAEFLATGCGGDDVVLCAAEKTLASSMLFTGFLGDTLWAADPPAPEAGRDYVYRFPAGGTLGEFRLRAGFVHVPIPLLTYTRHPDIAQISRSTEMQPWRIGGAYDRPIPRRLVESAGVPRSLYATSKKAVTQPFWLPTEFAAVGAMLSAPSREDLLAYIRSRSVKSRQTVVTRGRTLAARAFWPATRLIPFVEGVNRRLKRHFGIRLLPSIRIGQFHPVVLFGTPLGLKFHWAVEKLTGRYCDARQDILAPPLANFEALAKPLRAAAGREAAASERDDTYRHQRHYSDLQPRGNP